MNFKNISVLALIASLLTSTGCAVFVGDEGIFRGRSQDYLKTGNIKPIVIPEGMSSVSIDDEYFIPQVQALDEFGEPMQLSEYEVPAPVAIAGDKKAIGVKIQKLSGKRWIFLDAPTSRVWPRAQSFLTEYGIQVDSRNAKDGVVETAWLKFKDDAETYSKFHILIEKGIHPETTEISVIQVERKENELTNEAIQWPEASMNEVREKWVLDEMASTLAASINDNTASLMGQNVGGDVKAQFEIKSGEPVLTIRLPLARARATVAHSLDKEGFILWEEDSNTGLYYATYIPEEEGGFFSWLIPGDGRSEKQRYSLAEVLKHLASTADVTQGFSHVTGVEHGSPLKKAEGYLLIATQRNNAVFIQVRDVRGQRLPKQNAKDLLRVIRRNLI